MLRFATVFATIAVLGAPAYAQVLEGCAVGLSETQRSAEDELQLRNDMLVGEWTVSNGAGHISGPQMNMPLPPGPDETILIGMDFDGILVAGGSEWNDISVNMFHQARQSERVEDLLFVMSQWHLEADFEFLDGAFDCDAEDLPLVTFQGLTFVEGQQLEFEAHVFFVSGQFMTGVFQMNFMGHLAQRAITATR